MKRLLRYFRARRFDRELADEMQAHMDEKADDLVSVDAAEVHRKFGNRTRLAEQCREKWAYAPIDELFQDLRYSIRILRKSPVFSTVAVLSLALGIGANTVIFSAVDSILLRALPYPSADRLFAVWSKHGVEPMHVSAADFYDWQGQSRSFQSLSAYASWPLNLTNVDEPRRLDAQLVSATLFSTLAVKAEIGRTFAQDEDREQSPFVVVISHKLWRALGESPQIVGRQLTLNGSQATVIGVMPASFAFPTPETEAWVPLSLSAKNRGNREGRWLRVIGRVASNARTAGTEMDLISTHLAAAYPATNAGWGISMVPLQEEVVGKTRPILLTLQAGALLLLLISSVNLANLLLARGTSRAHEIGVRVSLGAAHSRILRQLMVESAVLAALGGGAGIALAIEGIALVRRFGEGLIPRAADIRVSLPVLLFALAATILTSLLFGIAPALHAARVDIRSGTRGTPRNAERKRGLLIAIEVGLACVLLVCAGLLGESLIRLLSTAPGLRTDHMLTMRLTLARAKYPTNASQLAFFQQVLERTRSLPGVSDVGEISDTPLEGNNPTFEFSIKGVDKPIQAGLRAISAGYLQTAGIPIRTGRDFTVDDRASSTPVAIVNETLARRYWPATNAVDRTLRLKEDQHRLAIVGVVPDIKHLGLKADEGPVVYIPYAQKTQDWLAWTTLVARTAGEPLDLAPSVRTAIRELDKNQPIGEIGTLEATLSRSTAMPRFTTIVIVSVSSLALLIAVVGIYGLLAYTVAQRMPELGIRLTLGASPTQVFRLLVRQALVRVIAGVTSGLIGAWWLTRWLASLLFGVHPHDPVTFAGVAVVLVLVSLVAMLAPARRAMKIDPVTALRWE